MAADEDYGALLDETMASLVQKEFELLHRIARSGTIEHTAECADQLASIGKGVQEVMRLLKLKTEGGEEWQTIDHYLFLEPSDQQVAIEMTHDEPWERGSG